MQNAKAILKLDTATIGDQKFCFCFWFFRINPLVLAVIIGTGIGQILQATNHEVPTFVDDCLKTNGRKETTKNIQEFFTILQHLKVLQNSFAKFLEMNHDFFFLVFLRIFSSSENMWKC